MVLYSQLPPLGALVCSLAFRFLCTLLDAFSFSALIRPPPRNSCLNCEFEFKASRNTVRGFAGERCRTSGPRRSFLSRIPLICFCSRGSFCPILGNEKPRSCACRGTLTFSPCKSLPQRWRFQSSLKIYKFTGIHRVFREQP